MALSTARIHRVRGRPPLLAAGIISLIHSHSSSVRSLGYIFSFIYPFYTTHEDFSDRLLEGFMARDDIKVVHLGQAALRYQAMMNGTVDAAMLMEPFIALAEKHGCYEI